MPTDESTRASGRTKTWDRIPWLLVAAAGVYLALVYSQANSMSFGWIYDPASDRVYEIVTAPVVDKKIFIPFAQLNYSTIQWVESRGRVRENMRLDKLTLAEIERQAEPEEQENCWNGAFRYLHSLEPGALVPEHLAPLRLAELPRSDFLAVDFVAWCAGATGGEVIRNRHRRALLLRQPALDVLSASGIAILN